MQTQSVENVFARSWQLLSRNWIIIVPGLVIGLVAGILTGVFTPYSASYSVGDTTTVTRVGGNFIGSAIQLLAQVLTIAYTTGMAGAAWQRGTTTIDDGTAKFREDGGRILVAILLYALIAIALAIFTFGLGAAIFAFFALYAMPAVVLRNVGPIQALRESFSIASTRWIPTLVVIVMIFLVAIVVGLIAGALSIVPFLGPIVAALVLQALVAYFTIVIVGEYLALGGSAAADAPPRI